MTTRVKLVAVSLVVFAAGACDDALTAENYNNPDVDTRLPAACFDRADAGNGLPAVP